MHIAAPAAVGTFDVQARFVNNGEWEDVGVPGNPDTVDDGAEIAIPPIKDVLPDHSYVGDVFLCNAGDVDAKITFADLHEETTKKDGSPAVPGDHLVDESSILVENIDRGTILPANSCADSSVLDPPKDVQGILHFTTDQSFLGHYGDTSRIVIKITCESVQGVRG